jgi:transcriptional regulator with XRE-family HTH domain
MNSESIEKYKDDPEFWTEVSLFQLSSLLNGLLTEKKMTQKELAKLMGVSPARVSKILEGQQNLTVKTLSQVLFALGKMAEFRAVNFFENQFQVAGQLVQVALTFKAEASGEPIKLNAVQARFRAPQPQGSPEIYTQPCQEIIGEPCPIRESVAQAA